MTQQDAFGFTKIGLVRNLKATSDDRAKDAIWLAFNTIDNRTLRVRITNQVARIIWFNLSHRLFPRAADQITARMPTASIGPNRSLSTVHMVKIFFDDREQIFDVLGVNAVAGVHIWFNCQDAQELWADLESALGIVNGLKM